MKLCPKKDPWIQWSAKYDSVCPFELREVRIQIRCADGSESHSGGHPGRFWSWDNSCDDGNIIAYKVVS